LTRKLFRSDRLALGVVLLTQTVPLYLAGAVAMTIDPPFIFCWALASCFAVKAIFEDAKWAWLAAGLVTGIGFLAKYTMLVWLPIVLLFCAFDPPSRRHLKTIWPWLAVIIALACTTQIWVWNAQHDWVSFKHVNKQIGASSDARYKWWLEPPTFIGGQFAFVNPAVAVFLIGGLVYALSPKRAGDPDRRALFYLVFLAVPFFLLNYLITYWQKVQPNWPAPAYFGWIILGGYFIATRLRNQKLWNPWRNWLWAAVVVGVVLPPIIRDPSVLIGGLNRIFDLNIAGKVDPTWRMRGYGLLGQRVAQELKSMPAGSFILSEDYQAAAEMQFYVPGQPKTYCAGSYWKNPEERRRQTQYDVWPDRFLDRPELRGRDFIYIGELKDIPDAVDAYERLPDLVYQSNGLVLRSFQLHRCRGFKGMQKPTYGVTGY
jgi:hypothetical protein